MTPTIRARRDALGLTLAGEPHVSLVMTEDKQP